jgi:hypothetical protein
LSTKSITDTLYIAFLLLLAFVQIWQNFSVKRPLSINRAVVERGGCREHPRISISTKNQKCGSDR